MSLTVVNTNQQLLGAEYCGGCGNQIEQSDNFCRACGQAVRKVVFAETATNAPKTTVAHVSLSPTVTKLLNNRMFVITLIAFTGPMGLPALWFSEQFSNPTKVVTSVVFLAVTILLPLAIAWYWLEVAIRPLVDAFPQ